MQENQSDPKVRIWPYSVIFKLLNYPPRQGLLTGVVTAAACPGRILRL